MSQLSIDDIATAQELVSLPHLHSIDINYRARTEEWDVDTYYDIEGHEDLVSVEADGPDLRACVEAVVQEVQAGFPHIGKREDDYYMHLGRADHADKA